MPVSPFGGGGRSNGYRALGELLSGRVGTPGVYEEALRGQYDADHALQRARRERGQAMLALGAADNYQRAQTFGPEAYGVSPAEFHAAMVNPTNILGEVAQARETGWRQAAVDAALGDDWTAANANLMGVASGPQALATVQGQNLIGNRFREGGGEVTTTEQGLASIEADRALAGQRNAAANLSNVRAAAGGFAPRSSGGVSGAGGNQVFTFFDGGRQTTAVSPDGVHYFAPDGQLQPLPPAAVPLSGTRAVDELTRDNIRTGLDATLGELGASMPAPGADPYAQAVEEISGPLASTVGRAATFITGLGGDGIRQPQREAETFVDNVNQMVKRTLVNNPRFPQFEQRIVDRLLPGAGMSAGQQVTRANELRRVLTNQIEQKRADLSTADAVEARRINADIRQLSEIVNYMNRGPASTRSGRQPSEGLPSPPAPGGWSIERID